jgi:hypothetical protein
MAGRRNTVAGSSPTTWPSALVSVANSCAPSVALAPGRFSTTTG